jgi:5-methyltetrahydrofolate--homocysteine methyltransferase
MFGRDDFPGVQKKWDDFWEGRNSGPLYSVIIPKDGQSTKPQPLYLSWFDGAFQETADAIARWYESCEFYGAAVPCFAQSFGADDFASLLGTDLSYRKFEDGSGGTSWPTRILDSLKDPNIRFHPEGKWWSRNVEFYHVLRERLGDTVMIAIPTLTAGLDALSALYGPENLLMDMMDESELVHHALDQINSAYTEITAAVTELFEVDIYGSITRHGMYSKGCITVPQCDFSCMISPEFFEEFAMQGLAHEFSFMNGGEYHLDGADALKHLNRLVQIPELDIIQWVPGAGNAAGKDWTDLYRRILSLGKGLILGSSAENAPALLQKYRSKKLFITVWGIKTRMEAEDFLDKMEKIWDDLRDTED